MTQNLKKMMQEKTKKNLLWLVDLAINVGIIFGLVLIIQAWIIAPFDVSGSSMCDTLNLIKGSCHSGYGEKIIVNEAVYVFGEPKRGDIAVFKAHERDQMKDEDEKYFIKRVIGLPGEKLEIKNGQVYVTPKGETQAYQLEENYLNPDNKGNTNIYLSGFSTFQVPENHYFMLGDNRKASTDSRSCFGSTISIACKKSPNKAYVEKEAIRGKAWIIWWPLGNMRLLTDPTYPELPENHSA